MLLNVNDYLNANDFVSPGVNSRGDLVPSQGASRRRLVDNLANR
jgi:hypothetical protein